MKRALFLIFILTATNFAQFKKIVLLEVATNSGCGSCAASNELLNDFYADYYGGLISVRYHPNFPDPTDPMYLDNPIDNAGRIEFYNLLYTPQYLINGKVKGAPTDKELMWQQMNEEIISTPFWINISAQITSDSVKYFVHIYSSENISSENLKLHTSITQRMVTYSSPPGSNGETNFPSVMRKMLPNFEGISVNQINAGDSLTFYFATSIENNWDWKNLEIIAWLQDDETKEIYQANSSLPVLSIEPQQPDFSVIENGTILTLNKYNVTNFNNKPISFYIKSEIFETSEDIQIDFSDEDGNQIDSSVFTIQSLQTMEFNVGIAYVNPQSLANIDIFISNLENQLPYRFKYSFLTFSKNYDILLLDNSNSNSVKDEIVPGIYLMSLKYGITNSFVLNHWKDIFLEFPPKSVFLYSGNNPKQYSETDISFLLDYLSQNRNVVVSGNKLTTLRSTSWESIDFFDNYLDVQFVENTNLSEIHVIDHPDTLFFVQDFTLENADEIEFEVIQSKHGNSLPFLYYLGEDTSKVAGLLNSTDTTKLAFVAFDIARISEQNRQNEFLQTIFNWLDIYEIVDIKSEPIPYEFILFQNYPNPFNPSTEIKFSIAKGSHVKLELFNTLGEKVATLINKEMSAGTHNYQLSIINYQLPSGVYFYRLQIVNTENSGQAFTETKKMLLVK